VALLPSIRGLPRAFWYLWAGTLVNRIGGLVVPFFAIYLSETRGLSREEAGAVIAVFGLGQIGAGLLGGFLADRFGRRSTMVLGLGLGALFMLALVAARTAGTLAAGAFCLALVGEIYRPAMVAAVTDVVPEADRTRAYGLIYWAINLGFAIAPVLAGALATLHFELLFVGDALTSLAFAVIVLLRVPETRPAAAIERGHVSLGESLSPLFDRLFLGYAFATFLVAIVFQQASSSLAFDMRAHGLSTSEYGVIIALNGVLIVLLQPFAVPIVGRFRPSSVLAVAAVLIGAGFGIPILLASAAGYALSVLVWTLGEIAMSPVTPGLISAFAGPRLRGSYQGAQQTVWGIASMAAPLIGTAILERAGAPVLWFSCLATGVAAALVHRALAARISARARGVPGSR
jgi:MFS family permease